MHASNKPQNANAPEVALTVGRHAQAVLAMWHGSLGRTVRCVPTRRTLAVQVGDDWLFGKLRRGAAHSAAAEWRWLHVLPLLGLQVPEPVAWIGHKNRSLLVTVGLPGRSLDAWALDAVREGWFDELVRYACRCVAPVVRRLHDRGLIYRDLYWNHVFALDPHSDAPPMFLDVERVCEVRWQSRRWLVKDLAGLLASVPVPLPKRAGLRFLRAYLGERLRAHRLLLRAIVAKASRIKAHVPRYG